MFRHGNILSKGAVYFLTIVKFTHSCSRIPNSRTSVYFINLQNEKINVVPDDDTNVIHPLLSVQNILKIIYESCKKDICP